MCSRKSSRVGGGPSNRNTPPMCMWLPPRSWARNDASIAERRSIWLLLAGRGELGLHRAVPQLVGLQLALAHRKTGGRRDRVARPRALRGDRLLDRRRDDAGRSAEALHRAVVDL